MLCVQAILEELLLGECGNTEVLCHSGDATQRACLQEILHDGTNILNKGFLPSFLK